MAEGGLRDDFTRLEAVHTAAMEWSPSPSASVWRKRLERSGPAEAGRVTSVVRYDVGSTFPEHAHPDGEEILVLEGVFSDESGDYPAGTYLLNPEGFSHAPRSAEGCVLLVKLRQYAGTDRKRIRVDSRTAPWQETDVDGVDWLMLYEEPSHPERAQLIRFQPGVRLPPLDCPEGREIYVIDGSFEDEHGRYERGSWVRYPAGSSHAPFSADGCTLYVKSNHLG